VTVRGTHFIQEDSPDEIGRALHEWLSALLTTGLPAANPVI
jgi:hypothetical protein